MRYPDHLLIVRPREGGTTDPVTGVFTPAPPDTLYDGPADVQYRRTRALGPAGEPLPLPTAPAYLPPVLAAQALPKIRPTDLAEVTYDLGIDQQGEVSEILPMERAVVIRFAEIP